MRKGYYGEWSALEKVIVTGLLAMAGITAAVLVILTIVPSVSRSSQSVVEGRSQADERIKTRVQIITVIPQPNGVQVDAWLKNIGVASIKAIEKSDVFLIRLDGSWAEAMTYDNGTGGSKTWTGDLNEWNQGDTLRITIDLSADALTAGIYLLRIATPNGVISDHIFEVTSTTSSCDQAYPSVCIPPPPPDLDCGEMEHRNFQVLPPDPHLLDGDGDGVGCEQ